MLCAYILPLLYILKMLPYWDIYILFIICFLFFSNGREAAPFILSSFLIKPVQRVLKYPLLLSELNKVKNSTSKNLDS